MQHSRRRRCALLAPGRCNASARHAGVGRQGSKTAGVSAQDNAPECPTPGSGSAAPDQWLQQPALLHSKERRGPRTLNPKPAAQQGTTWPTHPRLPQDAGVYRGTGARGSRPVVALQEGSVVQQVGAIHDGEEARGCEGLGGGTGLRGARLHHQAAASEEAQQLGVHTPVAGGGPSMVRVCPAVHAPVAGGGPSWALRVYVAA
jgi:hypothetical protein